MRKKQIIIVLLFLLLFTACNQAVETDSTDLAKGIFYQVQGGNSQMYLFGSIHVGFEEMYPLREEVEDAFNKSDTLVLEIDLLNLDQNELLQVFMQYGFLSDGDKLSNHISEESFNTVLELVRPAHVDKATLENLKPWYAGQIATQMAMEETRFSSEHGVEEYFLSRSAEKEIIGLETISAQLSPFALLSDESNVIFLEESIKELANIEESLDELLEYWHTGNIDGVRDLRNEMMDEAPTASYKEYQEAFLNQRDKNMAVKLDELLQSEGSYFVVVGYLHLAGQNSIPELLIDLGYEVVPMYN